MRVLYDGKIYAMQKAGGINRYFASIINRLPDTYRPSLLVNKKQVLNYPVHPNLRIIQDKPWSLRFRPYRISNRLTDAYLHGVSAPHRYDVIHPTYYSLITSRDFNQLKRPVVLTVYDMINELFPEMTDPTGQVIAEKRHAILSAQAIICISENTKLDLLNRYAIPEDRIHVTYLASDIDPATSYGVETVPDRPYFLYVGSRAPYKNFDGLLKAFRCVLDSQPDSALCVVGPPFTEVENRYLEEQKLTHHVDHYGLVGDAHLAKLYRCSVGFVYPSLYEGFGIPPLEAMACGTVAIAANTSSLPEVVGDAGILFDPYSNTDLAEAMLSLLSSSTLRSSLVEKGKMRAKKFNWDNTVAETIKIYQSVC